MAPQNKISTLLLGHPIERSEVELGRLVLDPMYPDDEYYSPVASRPPSNSATGGDRDRGGGNEDTATGPIMKTSVQPFGNLSDILERARGTKLELNLLGLLSLSKDSQSGRNRTSAVSQLCYLHELRNPETYFREVCKEPEACRWMEEAAQRPRTSVYLVCGFQTLTDARIRQETAVASAVGLGAAVPVAMIASAAAGVPLVLPDEIGEVGARVDDHDEARGELEYVVGGERIYAVQCRKVRFSTFFARRRGPSLERKDDGNYWISYIDTRAGDLDEEDEVEAALADSVDVDDLGKGFERFDGDGIAGDQIIFKPETEDEEAL